MMVMKRDPDVEDAIRRKYLALRPLLDERTRRLWAATESRCVGYGGDAVVASATGLARTTIRIGRRDLEGTHQSIASVVPVVAGNRWSKRRRAGWMRWSNWWRRRREGIPCRRCGGPARAPATWPPNCGSGASRSATRPSAASSMTWATVFMRCARLVTVRIIQTATRNLSTSTPPWRDFRLGTSQ